MYEIQSVRVPRKRLPWVGLAILGPLASALAVGCSDDSAPRDDPPIPVARSSDAQANSPEGTKGPAGSGVLRTGPFERAFDGIRFSVPAGWKEVALLPAQQSFVDARFLIPTAHGDASLTFSSNAGGIDSNVQRWVGQFRSPPGEKPTIEEIDIGGKPATWVDLHGEFLDGAMGARSSGPIERMLGVAIAMGSRDFYLKLTGSREVVADVRDAFREFARGARVAGSNQGAAGGDP